MIAVDGSPLVFGPRSVARALQALLDGWARIDTALDLEVIVPDGTQSARRQRASLPAAVAELGATAFLSPWSAFPDLDVPVVALVHELPFVRGVSEGAMRAWRHRRWLQRNVRDCAAIVVPTQATRADVLALHPEASERVHVVAHGFDAAPWKAARRAPDPVPYVAMVGIGSNRRMAHKKGLDLALHAWRRKLVPEDLRLVLVGEPALPLVGGVEARPDLDDEALRHLVAGARLLLYPSRTEGFGYPPLEALAAGVPVVAADVPAVAEVTGAGALLVPPGEVDALGAGIHQLLGDPALGEACLHAGAKRIAALTPERAATGLRDVLRSVGVSA